MSPHAEALRVIGTQTLVAEALAAPEMTAPEETAAWLLRLSRRGWIIAAVAKLAGHR